MFERSPGEGTIQIPVGRPLGVSCSKTFGPAALMGFLDMSCTSNRLSYGGLASMLLAGGILVPPASATVEPQLYADSYTVTDGARTYSVLDIYLKASHLGDCVGGSVLGLSTHAVIFKTSKAGVGQDIFVHGGSAGNGWLPVDRAAKSWDSFIALGNRSQGAKVTNRGGALVDFGVAGNWTGASSFSQMNVAGSNFIDEGTGSGWFSAKGGNPYSSAGFSENPFARVSLYNSHWNSTYSDLYRGDDVLLTKGQMQTGRSTAAGSPVLSGAPGASLDFHWMVGRFAIDVTERVGETITMQAQFNVVGKNSSSSIESGTSFSGMLSGNIPGYTPTTSYSAYRVSKHFTFVATASSSCAMDLDQTGSVDLGDVALILMEMGPCSGCPADLDGDQTVDLGDVALALQEFGECN